MKNPLNAKSGDGAIRLALDLRADEISLFSFSYVNGWTQELSAAIEGEDFAEGAAALSARAREITGAEAPPADLWLPGAYILSAEAEGGREAAVSALSAATTLPVEDLAYDVVVSGGGFAVSAVETVIVDEALTHAKLWGFAPQRVTTREGHAAFEYGPTFAEPPRSAAPMLRYAGLAAGVAAVILGGFLAFQLGGSDDEAISAPGGAPPVVVAESDAPEAARTQVPGDEAASTSDREIALEEPQPAQAPADLGQVAGASRLGAASDPPEPFAASDPTDAAEVGESRDAVAETDAVAIEFSARIAPADLAAPARPVALDVFVDGPSAFSPRIAALDLSSPARGDRIEPIFDDPPDEDTALLGAEPPAAALSAPGDFIGSEATTPETALAAPNEFVGRDLFPTQRIPRSGGATQSVLPPRPAEIEETPAVAAGDLAEDEAAEGEAPYPIPAPRPGAETAEIEPEASEAEAPASEEEVELAPGPGAVAKAPAPAARPERPEDPELAPTEQAVAAAPTPAFRPKTIRPASKGIAAIGGKVASAKPSDATTVEAPRRSAPTGPGVAAAATLTDAMDLAKINLLGVFGTKGARRALLRMPSGEVKRVTQGAVVEGWVVSRINASSMRITRGGEAQTINVTR